MSTWVGFPRAVNLGAKRNFSSQDIVACVEGLGFTDVATHINTGNVRFSTTMRSRERITEKLQSAFAADRGFDVPVVLLTPAELREVVDSLDEVAAGHAGAHYVSLLRAEPDADAVVVLRRRRGASHPAAALPAHPHHQGPEQDGHRRDRQQRLHGCEPLRRAGIAQGQQRELVAHRTPDGEERGDGTEQTQAGPPFSPSRDPSGRRRWPPRDRPAPR